MWAHPWKLVKTHHVGEEERWNKCFYVWNHHNRIQSHDNSCALITDGRQGSVLVTKARSHKACANVPASKIASVGSIGGGLSQQSNSWYNMSYAGVYISLYTPLSPIASVGSIQGSESAVIRWATVTAGEPSLLCNECTARLLTLELAQCWNLGLKWPEMTLVGDANFTPSSPSCVGSLWPWMVDLARPSYLSLSNAGQCHWWIACWPGMRCVETTCNNIKVFHKYTSSP